MQARFPALRMIGELVVVITELALPLGGERGALVERIPAPQSHARSPQSDMQALLTLLHFALGVAPHTLGARAAQGYAQRFRHCTHRFRLVSGPVARQL